MNTRIYRDMRKNGHAATVIPLHDNRELRISTWKNDRGQLVSFASVGKREGASYTHALYSDYSKHIIVEKTRCTEKNVAAQHQRALDMLPTIQAEVQKHYGMAEAA